MDVEELPPFLGATTTTWKEHTRGTVARGLEDELV